MKLNVVLNEHLHAHIQWLNLLEKVRRLMRDDMLMMKNGQMLVLRDSELIAMNEDLILADGTRIGLDGRVTMADGTYQMLVEGQAILVDNQM